MPKWLELNDNEPPAVAAIELDGRQVDPQDAADLGTIDPPRRLVVLFVDAANPIDPSSLRVRLNGKEIAAPRGRHVSTSASDDGRGMKLEIDLERALASDGGPTRRHLVEATLADLDVDAMVAEVEARIEAIDVDRLLEEIERRLEYKLQELERLIESIR